MRREPTPETISRVTSLISKHIKLLPSLNSECPSRVWLLRGALRAVWMTRTPLKRLEGDSSASWP
jgi:hypothetical protein